MNQKKIIEATHASSIIITIVLLAVLAFMAVSVHANGEIVCALDTKECPDGTFVSRVPPDCEFPTCATDGTIPAVKKDKFNKARIEKTELLRKQAQERRQLINNAKDDATELRNNEVETGALKNLRSETRQNMKGLLSEQKNARASLHDRNMEMLRDALNQKKEEMRSRIEAHKEERVAKRQEYKARLNEKMQKRLNGFIDRIVNRMNAVVSRLEQIVSRISTRIQKMEDNGVDLTDAKAKLDDVNNLIGEARDAVSLLEDVSVDVITSETPKEQAHEIRDAAKVAKDSIKAVHTALMETVKLIKASVSDNENKASVQEGSEDASSTESATDISE